MVNIYGAGKTRLVMSCCGMVLTAIIFSLFLGLFMVVTAVGVADGSVSSSVIGGGARGEQEFQGEEQGQQMPQMCASSGITNGGTGVNTATGIVGDNNNTTIATTTSLYQNPEYGIQILYPENWIYSERENFTPFDFGVLFISPMDLFEDGTTLESGGTSEMPPTVGVVVMELSLGNMDMRLLGDIVTSRLISEGHEIISTNPNATLSGMPALEVVSTKPENRTTGMQVWTVQGYRTYGALYLSEDSRFEQCLPLAQDMISSFTIINDNTNNTTTSLTGNINGNATTNTPNTSNNSIFQTS